MPAFLLGLIPIFMSAFRLFVAGNIIGLGVRLLSGIGLYFYVMEPLGDLIMDQLQGRIGGAPQVVIEWVGYMQVDVYVQVILSAYTIVWVSNFVLRMRQA